jgi:hypothetical protein
MTLTTAGFEAVGFALPQVSDTCALTGKTQKLAANIVGTIPGASVNVAIIGQLTLNGKGKVTGTVSINGNYSNSVETVTGTYTEASDCTGTLQITPKGFQYSLRKQRSRAVAGRDRQRNSYRRHRSVIATPRPLTPGGVPHFSCFSRSGPLRRRHPRVFGSR